MILGTNEDLLYKYPDLDLHEIEKIRNFINSDIFIECMDELQKSESKKDISQILMDIWNNKDIKDKILTLFLNNIWIDIRYSSNEKFFELDINNVKDIWLLKKYDILTSVTDSIVMNYSNGVNVIWARIKTKEKRKHEYGGKYEAVNNNCYIFRIKFKDIITKIFSTIFIRNIALNNIQIALVFSLIGIPLLLLFSTEFLWEIIIENFPLIYVFCLILFNTFFYLLVIKNKYTSWNKDFDKLYNISSSEPEEIKKISNWNFLETIVKFSREKNNMSKISYIFLNNNLYLKYDFMNTRDIFLDIWIHSLFDDLIVSYLQLKKIEILSNITFKK